MLRDLLSEVEAKRPQRQQLQRACQAGLRFRAKGKTGCFRSENGFQVYRLRAPELF
jgi:hypothetical protein